MGARKEGNEPCEKSKRKKKKEKQDTIYTLYIITSISDVALISDNWKKRREGRKEGKRRSAGNLKITSSPSTSILTRSE